MERSTFVKPTLRLSFNELDRIRYLPDNCRHCGPRRTASAPFYYRLGIYLLLYVVMYPLLE